MEQNIGLTDARVQEKLPTYPKKERIYLEREQMKKILVADETKTLQKVYFDLLAGNYDVEATNDPREIIPRAQRTNPDLIIVNSDLPGFDAHAFCTSVKKAMNIPVVLLLDKHSTATLQINSCRADAIVTQPIDNKAFMQTIEQLLLF